MTDFIETESFRQVTSSNGMVCYAVPFGIATLTLPIGGSTPSVVITKTGDKVPDEVLREVPSWGHPLMITLGDDFPCIGPITSQEELRYAGRMMHNFPASTVYTANTLIPKAVMDNARRQAGRGQEAHENQLALDL